MWGREQKSPLEMLLLEFLLLIQIERLFSLNTSKLSHVKMVGVLVHYLCNQHPFAL